MQISVVLLESVWSTDRLYDYRVPEELEPDIQVGQYLCVPFGRGNRSQIALVMEIFSDREVGYKIKSIERIFDPVPVLKSDQINLLSYLRSRYTCTYGDALRLMVPAVVTNRKGKSSLVATLKDRELALGLLEEGAFSSLSQLRIVEFLLETESVLVAELLSALSISRSPLDSLVKKDVVLLEKQLISSSATLSQKEEDSAAHPEPTAVPDLSPAQALAYEEIISPGKKREFLLYGVTGSGKTEVYLQAAKKVLAEGGDVLFLVPEISLTPQMVGWINRRFPGQAAILHSRLTPKERYDQWDSIRRGEARVVVGARSAIFAPLPRLKLILMDEEQDPSYKSDVFPRYHVRDIARYRAQQGNAVLVLGSATPAVESFYAAKQGYTRLLHLPERFGQALLPKTHIIDMRQQIKTKSHGILSAPLQEAMAGALGKDEQVILFLNKRGYAGLLLCHVCGLTVECPNCSVAMTLHQGRKGSALLICHYCGRIEKASEHCPHCRSLLSGSFGLGTQQLEEVVSKIFPQSSIVRMDQDTTVGRDAHAKLLERFRSKEANILIGTQMIAKGHDFPEVTVVGIVSADLLLRASDFRAGERAFQLLTQAAGRAGRGSKAGQVFIQSFQPEESVLHFAAKQDYDSFFQEEILYRKRLSYPPFEAMGTLLLSHESEQLAAVQAKELMEFLQNQLGSIQDGNSIRLYGPIPDRIYRLRNRYRYRINIKALRKSQLSQLFFALQTTFFGQGLQYSIDIDPIW